MAMGMRAGMRAAVGRIRAQQAAPSRRARQGAASAACPSPASPAGPVTGGAVGGRHAAVAPAALHPDVPRLEALLRGAHQCDGLKGKGSVWGGGGGGRGARRGGEAATHGMPLASAARRVPRRQRACRLSACPGTTTPPGAAGPQAAGHRKQRQRACRGDCLVAACSEAVGKDDAALIHHHLQLHPAAAQQRRDRVRPCREQASGMGEGAWRGVGEG